MRGIISSTGLEAYKTCRDAFLFSMVNPRGLGPTKMPLRRRQHQYAICSYSGYGPTFGIGHDLCICNNANTDSSSYSYLGDTYKCPPGEQDTFFKGGNMFTVTDYEVFGLHAWQQSIQVTLHNRYLIHPGWYMKGWWGGMVDLQKIMYCDMLFIPGAEWLERREILGTRLYLESLVSY